MRLLDVAALSVANIRGRKLRSWLTVLGIVIAVASIVTLLSLAFGVQAQIQSRLNNLNNDIIQITPGGSQASRGGGGVPFLGGGGGGGNIEFGGGFRFGGAQAELTFDDANRLKSLTGIAAVDPRIQGRQKAVYKGMNASLQVIGVDPQAFNVINTVPLIAGKPLNSNDKGAVLLGYRAYTGTFQGEDLLNRQIKIGDSYFRVVGALNQSSGSFVTSDNAVYMPIDSAKILLNESTNVNQIFLKVRPGLKADDMAAQVQIEMENLHKIQQGKDDFTITTASFFASTASSITDTLVLFLGGIAAISLIVGAIGVANTMFMSVLERTKEIGILKALGMKDGEVTAEFIIEAGIIGLLGGVIGIVLSLAVIDILNSFGTTATASTELIVGAIVFSAFIGIISGVLPARNAAHLQPVEALRYE